MRSDTAERQGPAGGGSGLHLVDFRVVVAAEHPRAEEIGRLIRALAERLSVELSYELPVTVGAEPDGDTILIRAYTSDPPEGKGRRPCQLTPRQLQILRLLDRGLLSKQIAAELGLSRYTVNNHIHAVLRKFDAPSRARALHSARQLHLI